MLEIDINLLFFKENLDAMMTRSPNGCHKFTLRDKSVEFKFKDMVLYTTKNTQRLCDVRRRPVLKIPSVKQRYVQLTRVTHSVRFGAMHFIT